MLRYIAIVPFLLTPSSALLTQGRNGHHPRSLREDHQWQFRTPSSLSASPEKEKLDCDPCASNLPEDVDLDRREAFFSMLGMAWAAGTLPAALLTTTSPQDAAYAVYGSDAKIELPNPIQSMTDRATKQCLVESLGTRECLVYADMENRLYQGADGKLLLERVETASQSLGRIPALVEAKKWSQVTGVLTGPMGELIRTMNQLVELSENKVVAKSKVTQVKNDLYAIAAAVDRKQIDVALKSHQDATNHLVDFVKAL